MLMLKCLPHTMHQNKYKNKPNLACVHCAVSALNLALRRYPAVYFLSRKGPDKAA